MNQQIIPQEAFDWYDEYAHGQIDRREFMGRIATLTISGMTIGSILSGLLPNYALAEQVSFNDPEITASYQEFDSPLGNGTGKGYLVTPKAMTTPLPVVLVVHENRGLNPYIEDVTRRLAKQGFIAFAPDILHTLGGYPGNDDEGRAMQKTMDKAKIEQDFIAAARFIKQHDMGNGKCGVVGFCFGGYISNMLAATLPDTIDAASPFYGTPPPAERIADIKAPLLLHFGALDKRVNGTWGAYEAALIANNKSYEAHVYDNVNHGFHNDSTSRYHEASAELAWSRTLEFFNKHLRS